LRLQSSSEFQEKKKVSKEGPEEEELECRGLGFCAVEFGVS
jgi:hypothetical protein